MSGEWVRITYKAAKLGAPVTRNFCKNRLLAEHCQRIEGWLRKSLFACAAAFVLIAPGAAPANAQQVERIAAVVNDKIISVYDLRQRIEILIFSADLPNTAEQRRGMAPQVIRGLIDEALQTEEAGRRNVRVSTRDMDNAIGNIEQANNIPEGRFEEFVRSRGLSSDAALAQIRAGIAWQKLIRRQIVPTIDIGEEEIDAVIKSIRAGQGQTQYRVSEILLPVDDATQRQAVLDLANRLVTQLRLGSDFVGIARQFSKSASAATGGDIGWIQDGELVDEANRALALLDVGRISDPIQTLDGYLILRTADRRKLKTPGEEDTGISLRQLILPLPQDAEDVDVQSQLSLAREVAVNTTSCDDFAELAREMGTPQPAAPAEFRLGDLNAQLREVASDIAVGVASKPLLSSTGVQIIMVCGRKEAGALPRDQIRDNLLRQRVDMLSRRYLRDLRRAAFVDLRV
jgi:peptidyl-prolyl cis-trans isomerase SurA